MKKIVSLLMAMVLICGFVAVPAQAAGTKTYSDVPSNYWASYYISRSTELGIMFGFSDGRFYPDNALTKAELAQILYSASPEFRNGESDFTLPRGVKDVSKKAWYYTAVAWLYEQMKSNDYYGFRNPNRPNDLDNMRFDPDSPVRRDYVANVIRCMAGNYGYKFYDEETARQFRDYKSMSTFLRYSVSFVVDRDVMTGNADGYFDLAGTITRAEAAQIFLAYYDELMGQVYPNKIGTDYLYINNQTIGLFTSKHPTPNTGTYVSLYNNKFIYGRNTDSVLGCLSELPEQMVFTTQVNGTRQNYYIAKKILLPRGDIMTSWNDVDCACEPIYDAYYDGVQYDLALMTGAGDVQRDGDTPYRLIVFAYKCY